MAAIRVEIANTETRLVRWMFAVWSTNVLALAALAVAVLHGN